MFTTLPANKIRHFISFKYFGLKICPFRRDILISSFSSIWKDTVEVNSEPHSAFNFESNFYMKGENKGITSIYGIGQGRYFDEVDSSVHIPEGSIGKISDEFETGDRTILMARESEKFLCRVIEEYEAFNLSKPCQIPEKCFQPSLELPGLTDREEWPNARLKILYYGKDLLQEQTVADTKEKQNFSIISGEGSLTESLINSLKSKPEFPRHYLLTGNIFTTQLHLYSII